MLFTHVYFRAHTPYFTGCQSGCQETTRDPARNHEGSQGESEKGERFCRFYYFFLFFLVKY